MTVNLIVAKTRISLPSNVTNTSENISGLRTSRLGVKASRKLVNITNNNVALVIKTYSTL